MKKWMLVILTFVLLLSFSACKAEPEADIEETAEAAPVAETTGRTQNSDYVFIAYITDGGVVDDAALNHSCWAAVEDFADVYSFDHAYYKPDSSSTEDLMAACEEAIADGARTLVCPGADFIEAVSELGPQYPDISFLLVDVDPTDAPLPAGAYGLHYREEQAGFLAGYAAVNEGLLDLGIMGGEKTDANLRYGYGFIQGVDYAAGQLSKEVKIRFGFSGSPDPSESVSTTCAHWYEDGVQAIFCVGGNLYRSTVQAAEAAPKRWVIASDVNRSEISKTVLSSARKGYYSSVNKTLLALMESEWIWDGEHAGAVATWGLLEEAVNLPTDSELWRFETFKVDKYKEVLKKLTEPAEDKDDKDSKDSKDEKEEQDAEADEAEQEVKPPEITVSDDTASPPETAHCTVEYLN